MSKYRLPCTCGQSVVVETTQAGETVSCQCGRTLEVPTLRALRQLEPAVEDGPARPTRDTWSIRQGILFGIGLVVLLAGAITAGLSYYQRSQVDTFMPSEEIIDQWVREVDQWPAERLWAFWVEVRDDKLPPVLSPHMQRVSHARQLMRFTWSGIAVSVLGLIVVVSALLIGSRPKAGRSR